MGNLNKVMLMGRLTREPEVTEFANGGKVAQLGFAVNNRRKNAETGVWEDAPVWLELKAFNRDNGRRTADLAAKHLHKGMPVFVEGHLAMEEWEGRADGKRHSRTLVYVDHIEFLGGGKRDATGQGAGEARPAGGKAWEGAPPPAKADGRRKPAPRGKPAERPCGEDAEDAPF